MTLTSFSQNVTRDTSLVLPLKIGRLIVKDLISGDLAKKELKLTKEVARNHENKIINQNYIINEYKNQVIYYDEVILNKDNQIKGYKDLTKKLSKDLKKEKSKVFLHKLGSIIIIGGLSYLYLIK